MSPDRNRPIEEFLAGGGDLRDMLQHVQSDEEREMIQDYLELVDSLERAGRAQRDDLARAAAVGPLPEGRAERHLQQLARPARGPHRARLLAAITTAAAALVALGLWLVRPPATDHDPLLGGEDFVELVHPKGVVREYAPFVFDATIPDQGWAEIAVWAAESDGTDAIRSGRLRQNRWEPAAEVVDGMPDRIRWSVTIWSGLMTPTRVASGEASAERP